MSEWAGAAEFRKAMRPRGAAQRLAEALDLWPANITRYKRGAEQPLVERASAALDRAPRGS